jgi:hypothetical protein
MTQSITHRLLNLLVHGIRIQIQIAVDTYDLSKETNVQIQKWYDELEDVLKNPELSERGDKS